jgi:hypothetical protein
MSVLSLQSQGHGTRETELLAKIPLHASWRTFTLIMQFQDQVADDRVESGVPVLEPSGV